MCIWVKRLDSGDDVLFEEGDFIPEVIPLMEGDDGNRVGLKDRDLWVCHFLEDGTDVATDGVVTEE